MLTVFSGCLEGKGLKRAVRASVCLDYRQAAGQLYVTQALTDLMREAPKQRRFLQWLFALGFGTPHHPSAASVRSSTPSSTQAGPPPAQARWRPLVSREEGLGRGHIRETRSTTIRPPGP